MSSIERRAEQNRPIQPVLGALVLELDSMEQATNWRRYSEGPLNSQPGVRRLDPRLSAIFAGQLRVPYLYAKRLVVTDTQIFDGVLMLEAGPAGVADILGYIQRTDLYVMLRRPTARDSLEAMLSNKDFVSSAEVAGWSVEELKARRDAWVRAIDDQRVHSAQWRSIDFAIELKSGLAAVLPYAEFASEKLLNTVIRSDALRIIEESDLDTTLKRDLFDWWNGAYMDVLARQHNSVWITITSRGVGVGSSRFVTKKHPISRRVVDLVSKMPGGKFASLISDESGVLDHLTSRERFVDRFRLRVLLVEITEPPRPIVDFVAGVAKIVFFLLLVVSTIPSWFDGFSAVWKIVIAIVLLIFQGPYLQLFRFVRLSLPNSWAVQRTRGWRGE